MSTAQLLLFKKEVTYGVDAVAAATDTVWAEDVTFTPHGDFNAPDVARPGVGPVAGWTTGIYGEITFSVPLAAAGTRGTAPKWGVLHKCCGYSETIVATTSVAYNLAADPSASDSASIVWREDRRLHKMNGSRGLVGYKFDENKRPLAVYKMKGLVTDVTDGARPVHTDANFTAWNDVQPITNGATVFTFAGATPPLYSLSIDQSDNVNFADRPGQKTVDLVGARVLTGKMKVGVILPSLLNLEARAGSNAVSVFSLVHGATQGSIVTVNGRAQNRKPSYEDDNGRDAQSADLSLNSSSLVTDDDFSIVLT